MGLPPSDEQLTDLVAAFLGAPNAYFSADVRGLRGAARAAWLIATDHAIETAARTCESEGLEWERLEDGAKASACRACARAIRDLTLIRHQSKETQ